MKTTMKTAIGALFALSMMPGVAGAHPGHGEMVEGLLAGTLHPLSGLDHVLAMVAVGIWAAQLGARAVLVLPVTFPLVMVLGGMLGAFGSPLPAVEVAIAISVIALGVLVAFSIRFSLAAAGTLVAIFALCHGYAHGVELPMTINAIAYSVGFVVATAALHILGIALAAGRRRFVGSAA